MRHVALLGVSALALVACDSRLNLVELEPGWERMQEQPRGDPYEYTAVFGDGRVMQTPPEGTIPRGRGDMPGVATVGYANGAYLAHVPIPVTRLMLESGRHSFETFCATCHGVLGDGNSVVAANMQRRRPPSLLDDRIRNAPDGRIFEVIRTGYGFMPTYAHELDATQRWAVVAYLRALELSQRAEVARLPHPVIDELQRELR